LSFFFPFFFPSLFLSILFLSTHFHDVLFSSSSGLDVRFSLFFYKFLVVVAVAVVAVVVVDVVARVVDVVDVVVAVVQWAAVGGPLLVLQQPSSFAELPLFEYDIGRVVDLLGVDGLIQVRLCFYSFFFSFSFFLFFLAIKYR